MENTNLKVAFIGFGEAGLAIASGLNAATIAAFDIKLGDNEQAAGMNARMADAGVTACMDNRQAVADADIVISVVTADQAGKAAAMTARHMKADALFLDMNSCAPSTKQASARVMEQAGAIYVDVAVMAPITAKGPATAMLAACSQGQSCLAPLAAIGLTPRLVGDEVGRASTIKMLRSVMVKGMEALTAECFRAAVRAGVAEDVASSLDASETGLGWAAQTSYNMERMTAHGIRRAAEMREVAKTLRDLEIAPAMTTGTIAWQQDMGDLDLSLDPDADLDAQMTAIEAAFSSQNKEE